MGLAVLGNVWGGDSCIRYCDCFCGVVSWVSGLETVSEAIGLGRISAGLGYVDSIAFSVAQGRGKCSRFTYN